MFVAGGWFVNVPNNPDGIDPVRPVHPLNVLLYIYDAGAPLIVPNNPDGIDPFSLVHPWNVFENIYDAGAPLNVPNNPDGIVLFRFEQLRNVWWNNVYVGAPDKLPKKFVISVPSILEQPQNVSRYICSTYEPVRPLNRFDGKVSRFRALRNVRKNRGFVVSVSPAPMVGNKSANEPEIPVI